MVSIILLIFYSSSPISWLLGTIKKKCKFQVSLYLFAVFYFYSMVRRNGKIYKMRNSLFLLINTGLSGLQVGIRWSVCISKSQRILLISFNKTDYIINFKFIFYIIYTWYLVRMFCFVLLLEEIQFLFWGFLMCNFVSLSLEISIQLFFFPFLFSNFCCFFCLVICCHYCYWLLWFVFLDSYLM